MILPALAPGAATVVLGLLAAAAWGCGDFGGGTASKRAPVFGVVLVVELVGSVIAVGLALLVGEPFPSQRAMALGVGAGVVGILGIVGLYHGLAVGRMGVVAPVAGVLGASIPVVAGIVLEGLPSPLVLTGIGLGILAVVLVSRVPGPATGRSGVEFGILAGLGIGGFNILISQLEPGEVFWPLAGLRLVALPLVGLLVVATHRPWRVPVAALPRASAVGVLDMIGNTSFILATQIGALAVAAMLASLYPVVTVLLAIAILGERVTRAHGVGIVAAAVAVVLIAAG